jgi:DNA-binding NarL/FixJ family response regulator
LTSNRRPAGETSSQRGTRRRVTRHAVHRTARKRRGAADVEPLQRRGVRRQLRDRAEHDLAQPVGPTADVAADEELLEAIRLAATGDIYLNPRLGARMAAAPDKPAGPPDDLTTREVDVLRLIALGHTNVEIGEQLFLSTRTVETHRAHIQQKLRRTTRAELVRYALEHGLVT